MPPAVGRCLAICPIAIAVHRQPARAMITPSVSEPPANSAPTVMENAAPAAGAIVVIDVKMTSGRPTALRRRPSDWRSVSSAVISHSPLTVTRPTRPPVLRGGKPAGCVVLAGCALVGLFYGPLGREHRYRDHSV